ncbi:hypothetical protein [uncultured Fibrobacter sp.]|jgi:hypothetical protein|uniref:hypothetical protein n=1 Tax=uncultured Fibrobacter sp. TaxID=261512 RepID=UPI0025DBC1B0|nr:hypothetical protein [uncultured Fibrobacter sp.]
MDDMIVEGAFNWTVAWSFLCCVLLVVSSVAILYIRDNREKQKLYKLFAGHMGEFIVVLSPKMEFLYGLPIFSSDPFFGMLNRERSLEDFLPAADWIRVCAYFKDTDRHPNMPFMLSYDDGGDTPIWYELRCVKKYYSSVEFHYVCFIRNISKEVEIRKNKEDVESKLRMLLENTGDFIWKFDVENHRLTSLTQVSGDRYRIIPIPMGEVDLHMLVPPQDYAVLMDLINQHVLAYHRTGNVEDGDVNTKIRGYRTDKSMVWYDLHCKLEVGDDGHLFYRGVARRMDVMLDNPLFSSEEEKDAMLAAAMSFPDIRTFWVDRNFIVQGCNQAFSLDMKRSDPEHVKGISLESLPAEKLSPMVAKKINDVFNMRKSVAWKDVYMSSDQYIVFNAVPLTSDKGLVQSVMCLYMLLGHNDFKSVNKDVN